MFCVCLRVIILCARWVTRHAQHFFIVQLIYDPFDKFTVTPVHVGSRAILYSIHCHGLHSEASTRLTTPYYQRAFSSSDVEHNLALHIRSR